MRIVRSLCKIRVHRQTEFITAFWRMLLQALLITAFKKTPDFQSGDELNADMSSSFGGNPAFQSGEDVVKQF